MPAARDDRRHAVLDHDGTLGDAVDVPEQPRRGLRHDHDPRAVLRDPAHGLADLRLRLRQDRMERGDDRLLQGFEKRQAVIVVDTVAPDAVKTELVLEVDSVDGGFVDRSCGPAVAFLVPLLDAPPDVGPVGARSVRLVNRGSDTTDRWVGRFYSRHEIGGERRDPAAPGDRGGDECNPHHTILGCHRFLGWQRHA